MVNRVKYIDKERMALSFSSYVFNVKSINKKFGSLDNFTREYDLWGETNGKIFYLSVLMDSIQDFDNKLLKPFREIGLEKGNDYVHISRHPGTGGNIEHPDGENISWLGSEVTVNGSIIWFADPSSFLNSYKSSSELSEEVLSIMAMKKLLTFKVLDSMDPMPSFPSNLFKEVSLDRFKSFEANCLPVFIETPVGIFPEEVSIESFEGQHIGLLGISLLSGAITIAHIRNGKRNRLNLFSVKGGKWTAPILVNVKKSVPASKATEKQVSEFELYEIRFYLDQLQIHYKGSSLPTIYEKVIIRGYRDFVIYSDSHPDVDMIGFLGTKRGEDFLHLFRLLYDSKKELYPDHSDLPRFLAEQLEFLKKIRNPFRARSKKNWKMPHEEAIGTLSNEILCIYFNNHININSLEADFIQKKILNEFRRRGLHFQNEYSFSNLANPVEIKEEYGTAILSIHSKVDYRNEKDIVQTETGPLISQLTYEQFYGLYNRLTDYKLIEIFNTQVGIHHWGLGRAAVCRAIRAQLKKRNINTSSIADATSFSWDHCVVLRNKEILRLGDLGIGQLESILKQYLIDCYPLLVTGEITIKQYDLKSIQFFSTAQMKIYSTPINDLIKRIGVMNSNDASGTSKNL